MFEFLTIPWFRLEPIEVPIPLVDKDLPIQPFGILVAIGVLFGAKITDIFARRNNLSPQLVSDMVAHVVISGFIFGYFLNAAMYEPHVYVEIFNDPGTLFEKYLGLSSYGGFFGAMAGLYLWRWRRKVPALPFADAAVFALPFGWLFGRLGCFTVHDHPGVPTDFFLGVEDYIVVDEAGRLLPRVTRHDLGLYEVIWTLACIAVLLVLARKKRPQGFYAGLVPILYAPVRFFLDYLRADNEAGGDVRYGALTPGQYASLAMLAVGVAIFWWIKARGPAQLTPAMTYQGETEAEEERAIADKKSASKKKSAKSKAR